MTTLAICILSVSIAAVLVQAAFGIHFAWHLRRRGRAVPPPDAAWPKVAVVMSLRGADPELADSLWQLLNQDYPDFELHVVVDNVNDPAWRVVRSVQNEVGANRLHLSPLTQRRKTCGLQCSAFVQAAEELDSSIEVVVTVDGDLMPHSTWLRELVAPLLDEKVGASFGNRWFMADRITWGVMVRYLWNVAAVVPMHTFAIPWGGSFAIRRSAFDEIKLSECWSKAIVHDAPVPALLKELGLRVEFVPSLMMVLRESCDLSFCRDFLKRQMTWTKMYHPNWLPIVLHAVATSAIMGGTILLMVLAAVSNNIAALCYSGLAIAIYLVGMLSLVAIIENSVRHVIRRRGEATQWMNLRALLMLAPALPLTQLVYSFIVLEATFRRRVLWRGVTYLLNGPWDIRLVSDPVTTPATSAVAPGMVGVASRSEILQMPQEVANSM